MSNKSINYVPHNQFRHIETRRTDEDWEDYLLNLSEIVSTACDKWLASRGIYPAPFINYGKLDKKNAPQQSCALTKGREDTAC
jgi:hypothetical protein